MFYVNCSVFNSVQNDDTCNQIDNENSHDSQSFHDKTDGSTEFYDTVESNSSETNTVESGSGTLCGIIHKSSFKESRRKGHFYMKKARRLNEVRKM